MSNVPANIDDMEFGRAFAELLGHTHLETTRIYGHLTPLSLKKVVPLLDW